MHIPTHITHYYSARQKPFQNLCDLETDELERVLYKLGKRRVLEPDYKRVYGSRYMALRKATETKLHTLFLERGGRPERVAPHYFVLGTCDWFANLYPDTRTIQIDWRSVCKSVISFTYPDSFIAMRLGSDYGLAPTALEPYHDKVFSVDALPEVVERYGLPDSSPDNCYSGYQTRKFEKYIEVQIWSDEPVSEFLSQ